MKNLLKLAILLAVSLPSLSQNQKVLIFSKTAGYRHGSIPFAKSAIEKLGRENGFSTEYTEDSELFNDLNLRQYDAVIFSCTTGDVLSNEQQAAFERYIQAGGGYVGIHSAADTEYNWPWYGELAGAYFSSHPSNSNVREATVNVLDKTHISTSHLPSNWVRTDEWYSYKDIYHGIKILANLDEHTYTGGTNGANHPIAWYHEYDGGRSFFTGGGHTNESFSQEDFLKHLMGGISYAMGNGKRDYSLAYSRTVPQENRFEKTVLVNDLNNPMELAVSHDGKVYFTELAGKLSVYNTKTDEYKLMHRFPLTLKGGTGLIGITLDPNFNQNRWMYLYYSPPVEGEPIDFYLSRFTITKNDEIDLNSEKVFLKVPVQINSGAHHGGSLAFDSKGVLVLSTGDGTTPFPSDGYAPLDERPDPESFPKDAQRGTSNTNDYKGKILRIIPHADGSYSIPEGNLFPKGMEKTLPEIYAMGVRNPYRLAINPKTNTVYWGEIGPDAGEDSNRGPRGYDEFNQAKKAGFFGWPYFIANNIPYSDWDFETEKPTGKIYDPKNPENDSPNNTGLKKLPLPQPAMIYYPYALSDEFPELGLGGRSAMAGEFYTFDSENTNPRKIPKYYDGGLFVFEWMRNWMRVIRFDENEDYVRSEAFMPTKGDFRRPIDLAFEKDGIMYVLEYGSVYGADNVDARLVKIEYNPYNRAPKVLAGINDTLAIAKVRAQASTTAEGRMYTQKKSIAGAVPLTVSMSARATDMDFGDKLTYKWNINGIVTEYTSPFVKHTFKTPGEFEVVIEAMDKDGLKGTDTLRVTTGNAPPMVEITSTQNRSFYWEDGTFNYLVKATDLEDKRVNSKNIKTSYNYSPQPLAPSPDISGGAEIKNNIEPGSLGRTLIEQSDCKACHTIDQVSVGPSFSAIAARYRDDRRAVAKLATKIIEGGGGNWGSTHVMSAHPQISQQDAREMVNYIFSLSDPNLTFKEIDSKGSLTLDIHKSYETRGYYTLKSEVTDKGTKVAKPQTSSHQLTLRFNELRAMDADMHPGFPFEWGELRDGDYKSYILYKDIDLSGIKSISMEYASKDQDGYIEIRKNSIGGPILGTIPFKATGTFDQYEWSEGKLEDPQKDFMHLYFVVYKKDPPFTDLVKPKTFRFNKE